MLDSALADCSVSDSVLVGKAGTKRGQTLACEGGVLSGFTESVRERSALYWHDRSLANEGV